MHDLSVEESVVLLQGGHGGLGGDVAVGSIGRRSLLAPAWTSLTAGVHLQRNSRILKRRNRGGNKFPQVFPDNFSTVKSFQHLNFTSDQLSGPQDGPNTYYSLYSP